MRAVRAWVGAIRLSDGLIDYIVDLARATREHPALEVGASTRAANMLASAVRAYAVLQGRDYVIPDDVKTLLVPALRHRVMVTARAETEGQTTDRILERILEQTSAPR